jgi:hypothetical protein
MQPDMQTNVLLAAVNGVLSLAVVALAVHRLNITTGLTRPGVRIQFLLLAAAGSISALRWLLFVGEWPGMADCMIAAALLAYMALGYQRWRQGAPADTCTCEQQPTSDLMGLDVGC